MNMERAALRGEISVLKESMTDLRIDIQSTTLLMRNLIPAWGNIGDIKSDEVLHHAKHLSESHRKFKEAEKKLGELEDQLDG
jgi:hypothetical protein